ncbi:MAG: response regulator [Proteobacteria bacterium]|nr:response regulator [Pseudomonadota bacterium]MBU4470163.1 response regulator [Pseudomonadota bacterium]MCG2750472.1 response regulator [Desulfobacteraceae bacterium]
MNKKTILVVEDNELNMKLLRGLLKMSNYTMLEAFNAETGIETARKHKPDLILMDIQLPGMDGLEATKVIRQDEDLKHTPIIALTSYAMRGDKDKALEAGCTGYITKPINTKGLIETLKKFFLD